MVALQTPMQFLKFRIKRDLHMTVSKKTFKAGIHGPFSPRTAWSDFCLSESARSFKFCVVPGPNWPDISYFSVVDLDSTNRLWSVDPQSRTSMIMIINKTVILHVNRSSLICSF